LIDPTVLSPEQQTRGRKEGAVNWVGYLEDAELDGAVYDADAESRHPSDLQTPQKNGSVRSDPICLRLPRKKPRGQKSIRGREGGVGAYEGQGADAGVGSRDERHVVGGGVRGGRGFCAGGDEEEESCGLIMDCSGVVRKAESFRRAPLVIGSERGFFLVSQERKNGLGRSICRPVEA
jgi:hypothetical protein